MDVFQTHFVAKNKWQNATWFDYGFQDDSSEHPAQPSGSKNYPVLRVVSIPSSPLKALTRDLYRLRFTTYKVGEIQGTFMLQVDTPIKVHGLNISSDPMALK